MMFTAKSHSIYLGLKILHIEESVNKDILSPHLKTNN